MGKRILSNEPEGVDLPVISLALSKIRVDPEKNLRRNSPEDVEKLAESIVAQGLLSPLIVAEISEEEFKADEAGNLNGFTHDLVAGFRRMAALNSIDPTQTIQVKVTDRERHRVNLTENVQRKELGLVDLAYAAQKSLDAGDTVEQVAQTMGKSQSYIRQILPFLKFRTDIQKRVNSGEIGLRMARDMTQMDEGEQDALIARVDALKTAGVTGATTEAVNTAKKNRRKPKSKRGRKSAGESTAGAGISAKKALLQLEEEVAGLKEAAKMEGVDPEPLKDAVKVIGLVMKYLSGGMGVQALAKALTKRAAAE